MIQPWLYQQNTQRDEEGDPSNEELGIIEPKYHYGSSIARPPTTDPTRSLSLKRTESYPSGKMTLVLLKDPTFTEGSNVFSQGNSYHVSSLKVWNLNNCPGVTINVGPSSPSSGGSSSDDRGETAPSWITTAKSVLEWATNKLPTLPRLFFDNLGYICKAIVGFGIIRSFFNRGLIVRGIANVGFSMIKLFLKYCLRLPLK